MRLEAAVLAKHQGEVFESCLAARLLDLVPRMKIESCEEVRLIDLLTAWYPGALTVTEYGDA